MYKLRLGSSATPAFRGLVSARCRRVQRRRGPGRCRLLPVKPPEVGDEVDVHVPLHLLRQPRQNLHCFAPVFRDRNGAILDASRSRELGSADAQMRSPSYRFGDAAQDSLWHQAQGRRQDAGDGDLQVAPHPAPEALAPAPVTPRSKLEGA